MKDILRATLFVFAVLWATSCSDAPLPKPRGHLALDYKNPSYKTAPIDCPYRLVINDRTQIRNLKNCDLEVGYPDMKATIYLNYSPVDNNLRKLLLDGQKLAYNHSRKADMITDEPYVNPDHHTYGMMYQIDGNAASNVQFYMTDSLNHFVTASLYFYTEPNYDSIYPAVQYVKNDMRRMVEGLQWE